MSATLRKRYRRLEKEFLQGVTDPDRQQLQHALAHICSNLTDVELGELSLMHRVALISRLNRRHSDQQLKTLGFTRCQWLVLATVSAGEGLQQAALADMLHMQRAPLGVLVEELAGDGWIERRRDPDDGRAWQLFLSERCRQQWPALTDSYQAIHARAMAGLAPADRRRLGRTLRHIRSNLQAMACQLKETVKETP